LKSVDFRPLSGVNRTEAGIIPGDYLNFDFGNKIGRRSVRCI
jgi:hypothetical protein